MAGQRAKRRTIALAKNSVRGYHHGLAVYGDRARQKAWDEAGDYLRLIGQQMWLLVPMQQKIETFFRFRSIFLTKREVRLIPETLVMEPSKCRMRCSA
jgi:hypothetical protein